MPVARYGGNNIVPAWIFGTIQSLENEGILYVFLVFQAEEVGRKDGCGSQTQLRGVALTKIKMKNLLILTCNIRRSMVAFTY